MARAFADGAYDAVRFADPTAITLLPEDARNKLERMRHAAATLTAREHFELRMLEKRAQVMVARTVAIDDAIRKATSPQLVILGAGLDGRAWRMPELENVVVFEVDHPDSQREKRERATALTQTARDVRFVPVDFKHGHLTDALTTAGHDPTLPTTWVWEGVVMYLERSEIAETLRAIASLSAKGSQLVVMYLSPAWLLALIGIAVRRVGEPLRSIFTEREMRSLLVEHGFVVTSDLDAPSVGSALSMEFGRQLRRVGKHIRFAEATIP